jgi:hypothetical protein
MIPPLSAAVRVRRLATQLPFSPGGGCAPDGVSCVAAATAEIHERRLRGARWVPVPGSRLAGIAPEGLDILVSPGDAAQLRLLADALRGDRAG